MTRRRMALVGVACLLLAAAAVIVALSFGSAESASARSWGAASRIPVPTSSVGSAQTAVDDAGGVHVLFSERRAGAWVLRQISRPPGAGWSDPQTVVASSPFRVTPAAISANRRGDLAALWLLSGGRRAVLMSSVMQAGARWEPEQALSRVGPTAWGRLVVAPDGAATVIGRGLAGPGLWAARHDPGERWEPARRISPAGLGVDAPAVAVAPDGRVGVVALAKRPGTVRSLFSVVSSAGGTWGRGRAIAGSEGARSPVATFAADGTLMAGWSREAGGRVAIESATLPPGGRWARAQVHDRAAKDRAGMPTFAGTRSPRLAWTRWNGPPQRRLAEVRSADPAVSGAPGEVVAAPVLPPVARGPGGVATVVYGLPPLQLVGGGGEGGVLLWGQPGAAGSSIRASTTVGPVWAAPVELSGGPGFAYPVAAGGGSDRDVAVWAAGPPMAAADRLLLSER